jgi:AcrR family transcriptional regulator
MPRRASAGLSRTRDRGEQPGADGRVLRGARNRAAIVDALAALVKEGELVPTAEQVAQRAGVGTRTVFRHFEDMDSLFSLVSERVEAEYGAIAADPFEGPLEKRIGEMVQRRSALFERIAPFKRSANVQRRSSAFLQANHKRTVKRQRAWLLRALPELERADPALLEAIDLVTSIEAWDRLRVDQRLGRERALHVMERSVRALLGKRP